MTEIQNIFSGQGSAKNQVSFDDTILKKYVKVSSLTTNI